MSRLFVAAAMILGVCPAAVAADPIRCQGEAGGHLRGFASDGEFIYWSMFTNDCRDLAPAHGCTQWPAVRQGAIRACR